MKEKERKSKKMKENGILIFVYPPRPVGGVKKIESG